MTTKSYRSANVIIQNILEEIIHADLNNYLVKKGIVKSQLIKNCGLKVATAEKYLEKMEKAGYIKSTEKPWGERTKVIYQITKKGEERYQWFVKINLEME